MLAHVVRACGALHGSLPRACRCECVRYVRAVCAVYVCGARVRCVRCVHLFVLLMFFFLWGRILVTLK